MFRLREKFWCVHERECEWSGDSHLWRQHGSMPNGFQGRLWTDCWVIISGLFLCCTWLFTTSCLTISVDIGYCGATNQSQRGPSKMVESTATVTSTLDPCITDNGSKFQMLILVSKWSKKMFLHLTLGLRLSSIFSMKIEFLRSRVVYWCGHTWSLRG